MYEKLFESDAAGDQCKFAETVREQSLMEYNELITDLQTSMVVRALFSHDCSTLNLDLLFLQIVLSKNSRSRPILSKEEMIALQARHDDYGGGSGGDDSTVLVTMETAISSWSAVDCRCFVLFCTDVDC
jgi:hypothetical protein